MFSNGIVQCANGLKIFTKAWGEIASGRKVLALHGYLDNTGSFDVLGPALAKEGLHVVAMDFPGHGRSDALSKDNWYSMVDYPEYVIEASRTLGWERFSIVGHSMGGAVAAMVAASFPELIERCVFIDMLGPMAASPAGASRHLRRSIEDRRALLQKAPKLYTSFEEAVRQRLKSVSSWGEGQTLSWDGAASLVAGCTTPSGSEGQVKFTNDVRLRARSPSYLSEEGVIAFLRDIKCPCLIARGDKGIVSSPDAISTRKKAFRAPLQDLILPGSHHLHLDEDSALLVASHIAGFLCEQQQQSGHDPIPSTL